MSQKVNAWYKIGEIMIVKINNLKRIIEKLYFYIKIPRSMNLLIYQIDMMVLKLQTALHIK